LRFRAEHDDLTGLYKRNFFDQSIKYACEIAKYGEIVSSVFYIDFNKFKHINDTYGHQAGDLVLKKIAELFIAYFRRDDIAARLGGDEFAVLLINTRYDDAQRMSIKLIQKVLELRIPIADVIITPSISIGIAEISKKCFDPQVIMAQADQACYLQKKLDAARNNITAR
jgi:diguanylate cyclase (GGDEF)-like protein